MAVPPIRPLDMQEIKSFGNLARTNLFQVTIDNVGSGSESEDGYTFSKHLANTSLPYNITDFATGLKQQLSILCYEATLPASSYATAEVKDNYLGVTQEFAHTRINTDVDFSFYVDRDYKVLMFFEAWMDYISGGSEVSLTSLEEGYYRRFRYPNEYKTSNLYIKKFENDWSTSNATNVSYQFINAFPKSVNAIPITYGSAEILKVTVTMNYDRYIPRREYAPIVFTDGAGNTSAPGNEIAGFQGPPTPGTTTAGE